VAADVKSTSRILVHIIDVCFQAKQWDTMQEYLVLLIKRRGQLKKVFVVGIVLVGLISS